jgi:HrpA-like RNA helicase
LLLLLLLLLTVVIIVVVVEKRLVEEVRKNGTLIVVGETGSGKTTRECWHCVFFH